MYIYIYIYMYIVLKELCYPQPIQCCKKLVTNSKPWLHFFIITYSETSHCEDGRDEKFKSLVTIISSAILS